MQTGLGDRPTIVIVSSVHDYRMARRGSIQAIADAFKRSGFRTIFLSVRFSALSLIKHDPRAFLLRRANTVETWNGVECYLWLTPLHPFATGSAAVNRASIPFHDVWASWPSRDVDRLFSSADVVMVESGLGTLLIPRIRRLNKNARVIYRASDALDTIGAHPLLQRRLEECAGQVDHFCLLARGLAPQFRFAISRTFVVGQGVNPEDFESLGPTPYVDGVRNAVSVGSMLFDPSFFDVAAAALPEITFHIIGCGQHYGGPPNVRVYPEMPFREALTYVKHADAGVAPYRLAPGADYLADSSLKLTQFAYLRRPAICPHFAVGAHKHRFGYAPGNKEEIISAVRGAFADTFDADEARPLTWDELAPRFLKPQDYPDTAIPESLFLGQRGAAAAA